MKNKKDRKKLIIQIVCLFLAALMVIGMAYMTVYLITAML
jgi:hypothetical protein